MESVAKLPAEQQVEAVRAQLRETRSGLESQTRIQDDQPGGADGVAKASDAVVAAANVTVEVRNSAGDLVACLSGVTDAAGLFTSSYLTNLPDDTYTGEASAKRVV